MAQVLTPQAIAAGLTDLWSPRVIAQLADTYVKVAKVHGQLGWHAHAHEDEIFLVLHGQLRIELEHGPAALLNQGDLFVVPMGVRHNPVAEQECHILLIEPKSTLHTGDEVTPLTRSIAEQLRAGRTDADRGS